MMMCLIFDGLRQISMDGTNRGINSNQRLFRNRSGLQRARSLSEFHTPRSEIWPEEFRYDNPSDLNSPNEVTTNPNHVGGYEINQQQNINYTPVEPFVTLSPTPQRSQSPFDVNLYQQKKTLAQGMMDLALISANANQMRYVMQIKDKNFYYVVMSMIIMSLVLQVIVGIGLIWNSKYDVKEQKDMRQANRTNNWTVVGIFLVTILNVFISSFGVSSSSDQIINNEDNLQSENYDAVYKYTSDTTTII